MKRYLKNIPNILQIIISMTGITSYNKELIQLSNENQLEYNESLIGKNVEVASIPNGYESKQVVELAEML